MISSFRARRACAWSVVAVVAETSLRMISCSNRLRYFVADAVCWRAAWSPACASICSLRGPKKKPPSEDARFANHCCDAGLYGYRAAWHYLHTAEKPKPVKGSQDYYAEKEAEIVQRLEQPSEKAWWEPDGGGYDESSDFGGLE